MSYLKSIVVLCFIFAFAHQGLAQITDHSIARPPLEIAASDVYYQAANNQSGKETELNDLIGNWPRRSIQEARIDIREEQPIAPKDRSFELASSAPQSDWTQFYAPPKVFAWAAPNIRYRPLYFEDVALERYGQTCGPHRQPWKSSFHFFNSLVLSPLKVVHDPPFSCDYPLGFCRPGDCVPTTRQLQILGHSNH